MEVDKTAPAPAPAPEVRTIQTPRGTITITPLPPDTPWGIEKK